MIGDGVKILKASARIRTKTREVPRSFHRDHMMKPCHESEHPLLNIGRSDGPRPNLYAAYAVNASSTSAGEKNTSLAAMNGCKSLGICVHFPTLNCKITE